MGGSLQKRWLAGLTILVILLTACRPDDEGSIIPDQIEMPSATEATRFLPPAVTPTPIPTETSPGPLPTFQPSPTPRRTVTVAASERWAGILSAAIDELKSQDGKWNWRLAVNEADISIEAGDDGQLFAATSTALTVNFWSALESITSEEASAFVSLGDDRITVMEWTEVPPERKTLKIDGLLPDQPGYVLQQNWSLASTPGYEEAAKELAVSLNSHFQADSVVKLAAVGD